MAYGRRYGRRSYGRKRGSFKAGYYRLKRAMSRMRFRRRRFF